MKIITMAVSGFMAFFTGWFFLKFLVVHPTRMSQYLALALGAAFALLVFAYKFTQPGSGWMMVAIALVFFLAGYYVKAKVFLNQEDTRFVPELTRNREDQVAGHTAIVYFTHGEPETYHPIGWINQFKEFDEQGIRFVPFLARPFFINNLRKKYLQVGKSNHRQTHQAMLGSLEARYRAEGDSTTRFYLCFLDDEPRPDAAVIEALNEGAGKVIVANVFLTVSNHTAEGQNLIKEVHAEERTGAELVFTNPLWDSDLLRSVFIEKVNARLGKIPKEQVAVALIGHGQPDEWDEEWATETHQEMTFREEIMTLFVEDGFLPGNLGSAWMEFKSPKPADLMEDFVSNGVKKIFYFSAAISADAIHSQADVPALVHQYNFPKEVEVINLGAWNNHPIVIQAIKERIDIHK